MPKNINAKSICNFYILHSTYFLIYSKYSVNAEHIHSHCVLFGPVKLILRFYVYGW